MTAFFAAYTLFGLFLYVYGITKAVEEGRLPSDLRMVPLTLAALAFALLWPLIMLSGEER